AEDGIRDKLVTGVQTCALPISRGEQFAGVTVALVTPFRGGEIDFAALRRLVEWHVEQGTDGLAPVGTTGESPTVDHEEHERVIRSEERRVGEGARARGGQERYV